MGFFDTIYPKVCTHFSYPYVSFQNHGHRANPHINNKASNILGRLSFRFYNMAVGIFAYSATRADQLRRPGVQSIYIWPNSIKIFLSQNPAGVCSVH